MNKILNFGSLNIDYVYKVDHFVRKGETIASESLNVFSGGKGLNQSVALSRAGLSTYHAGRIGEDGLFLLDVLKDAGVDISHMMVNHEIRTGNAIIQNNQEGDNCILLYGGANRAVTKEHIDATLEDFGKGDYIVLQNEINNLDYLINRAGEKGMIIVLNPSPMDEQLKSVDLDQVDWFLLNEIEASQLTGCDQADGEGLMGRMLSRFPKAKIVLTLGEEGSCYGDGAQMFRQPVYKVKAVDTTAAGDTFTGFFLSGIVKGMSVKDSLDLASKASALAVSCPGAAPSIPTLKKVQETAL